MCQLILTISAPEVSELPVTVQIDGTPNDVIMDMRFINMSTDHKCMVAFGESLCKFYSQSVGFFRRNLAGEEGLAHMISDYIIRAAHPSGGGNVLTFCQQELGISGPAVTSKSGNKSAVVRLLRIGRIVDDVADRLAFRAALPICSGMIRVVAMISPPFILRLWLRCLDSCTARDLS